MGSIGRAGRFAMTALALALVPVASLHAEDTDRDEAAIAEERAASQAELDEITRVLEAARAEESRLREEIAALDADLAQLNASLIRAARDTQELEEAIGRTEVRIETLSRNEDRIRASLDERRVSLARLLSAMLRLGRTPPPALAVTPGDALQSVRGAILLGAAFPEIRVEAEALAGDLAALNDARRQLTQEREQLSGEAERLSTERRRTELLLAERTRVRSENAEALQREQARAEELAATATSLNDLLARLEDEIASVRAAAEAAAEAARTADPDETPNAETFTDTARIAPAIPFEAMTGLVQRPVRGVDVRRYGEEEESGLAQGLSIATRAGARVTAPADGWVVYAGPFRSYGQLLILDAGGGYHVVLAGMDRIDVTLGQFVLMGEPVAEMGLRAVTTSLGDVARAPQPVLYVEIRKDGQAIDPGPWWSDGLNQGTSG